MFYSTLKDFWGTQYARALSLSLILILMDDGDNACNKDKDAFYYVLILKDCEEYSNCDFEIICSIFINTSHYPEPWRSAQQQAYLHQVIIFIHTIHVVYMWFARGIHNDVAYTMTVSIIIIISSSILSLSSSLLFSICHPGIGQSRLTSAVGKVCMRSLGKPRELWTASLKVRSRSFSSAFSSSLCLKRLCG